MAPKKLNIKERVSDGEIDLSMSDLQEVPVKDLAIYKKAYSLDLSNNHLKVLPQNFAPSLAHLTKLDLSKNQLKELPENFGDLTKLKYLDLYQNQLQYLPLSFGKLKSLKWLDLKDNPLVPAVAKVAGQCLDAKQCQTCAKRVVDFFVQVQDQITNDLELRQKQRQKQLEMNQQKQGDTKKSKKKEKNKQKSSLQQQQPQQQQQKQQKNGPIRDNFETSGKKSRKSLKTNEKHSSILPLLHSFFITLFVVLSIIFILTSIDCWLTRNIAVFVVNLFNENVDTLPPNIRDYALIFGEYVERIHGKTGDLTNIAINSINNKENIDYIYNKVNILKDLIQNKTTELYRNFAS